MARSRRRRKIVCDDDPVYDQPHQDACLYDLDWMRARAFVIDKFNIPYKEADDYLRAWRGTQDLHEFYAMLDTICEFTNYDWIPF